METKKSYAFVLTTERPHFFGEFVSADGDFVVLERPMIVEYNSDLTLVFNSDFMPVGYPPRYDKAFKVMVPVGAIQYVVRLEGTDSMTEEYLRQADQRDALLGPGD